MSRRWSTLDKPARLIIKLLFGFASDLTNSTNLQIVRRHCCPLKYLCAPPHLCMRIFKARRIWGFSWIHVIRKNTKWAEHFIFVTSILVWKPFSFSIFHTKILFHDFGFLCQPLFLNYLKHIFEPANFPNLVSSRTSDLPQYQEETIGHWFQ